MRKSRIALITGANRGIGLESARGLGELGITVILACRDLTAGQKAAAKLHAEGIADARAFQLDVNGPVDHRRAAEYLDEQFGKLDILINNAGISIEEADLGAPGGVNNAATVSQRELRTTFDTNFFNVVALTQTLLPLIKKSPAGRIVNLSSILGSLTMHSDENSPIYAMKKFAYDASKTALNAFTVHLAHLLRETNIKVNSAHPGWVKTDMGGPNAPLDIAEGGKTSVQLATLDNDGPTGGFFHLGQPLPW